MGGETGNGVAADRAKRAGATIASVFGMAWSIWAATGFSGAAALTVGITGVALGLLVLIAAIGLRRAAAPESDSRNASMFSSRAYLIVVALMVVAIFAGNVALNSWGVKQYVIVWTAAMVGIHFVAFARLFWAGYCWLGAALIAAAVAGLVTGIVTGDTGPVVATTGIVSAASLLVAGATTLPRIRNATSR